MYNADNSRYEKMIYNRIQNRIETQEYFDKKELEYKNSKTNYKDNSKKIADIKAEMERTTNSYNKGRMSEDKYDKEWTRLEKELTKLEKEPVKKDLTHLKDLTKTDWQNIYKDLTRENKQAFWNKFIDKIEIDPLHYKEGKEFINIFFK